LTLLDAFYILWRNFFHMCLFRLAPQQLPASGALLAATFALYAGLGWIINLESLAPHLALLSALADGLLQAALAASLLYLAGYAARLRQTLSALFGTGMVLNLFGAPLLMWFHWARDSGADIGFPGIFLLFLLGWSLSVTAHILRHALSTHFGVGLGLAFVFNVISIEVLHRLFPLPVVN
jgi:hypothetical protein